MKFSYTSNILMSENSPCSRLSQYSPFDVSDEDTKRGRTLYSHFLPFCLKN